MSNKTNFELNLIKVNSCLATNIYTGSILLEQLFPNMEIPIYEPNSNVETGQMVGYQRQAKAKRIQDVKNRIFDGNKEPSRQTKINSEAFVDNINLNIGYPTGENNVKPLIDGKCDFGDVFIFNYMDALGKFRIVDGQTRVSGAKEAHRQATEAKLFEIAESIGKIRVQITLSFCDDIYMESYIFYLINQYSKSIPPDGAVRLLHDGQLAGRIQFKNEVTKQSKQDLVDCLNIAQTLNETSEVWLDRVADYNQNARDRLSIKAVANFILPLLKKVKDYKENKDKNSKEIKKIVIKHINAFWGGLKLAFPEMFDPNTAEYYNVMKAGPAEILMLVLTIMYEKGTLPEINLGDLSKEQDFKKTLSQALKNLKLENSEPVPRKVSGSSLFEVGAKGVIGKYSNNAAKREFAKLIMVEVYRAKNLVQYLEV